MTKTIGGDARSADHLLTPNVKDLLRPQDLRSCCCVSIRVDVGNTHTHAHHVYAREPMKKSHGTFACLCLS